MVIVIKMGLRVRVCSLSKKGVIEDDRMDGGDGCDIAGGPAGGGGDAYHQTQCDHHEAHDTNGKLYEGPGGV